MIEIVVGLGFGVYFLAKGLVVLRLGSRSPSLLTASFRGVEQIDPR